MGHKKDKEANRKRRDLGIVILRDSQLAKDLVKAISVDNAEYLQLEEKTSDLVNPEQIRMFEQNNVLASRKQIFPIVQQVLNSAWNDQVKHVWYEFNFVSNPCKELFVINM